MYYLRPENNTMEAIIEKTSLFFQEEKAECEGLKKDTNNCSSLWLFNTCITTQNLHLAHTIKCPFYNNIIEPKCSHGKWNFDAKRLYNECNGVEYLSRVALEQSFYLYIVPFMLFIYITGIFYISDYPEVMKDFKWKFISLMLTAKSFSCLILLILVAVNSSKILKSFCLSTRFLPMLCDNIDYSCCLAIFLHTYSIIYYKNTQLRVIKSSLKHMVFALPIIITIISWLLDLTSVKHAAFFKCQSDVVHSNLYYLEITRYILTLVIYVFLYDQISSAVRKKYKTGCSDDEPYRTEYDILGERKEIANRELRRCIYVLRLFLTLAIWNMTVYLFQIYNREIITKNWWHTFVVFVFVFQKAPNPVVMMMLLWLNKDLRCRLRAWDLWNKELGRDEDQTCRDEEFLIALKETADINLEHRVNSFSQTPNND